VTSEGKIPQSNEDFESRVRRLRGDDGRSKSSEDDSGAAATRSGMAVAMRVGTEMVAALGVGVGVGLLLDRWLETQPWLLILFALLGGAAGILNVFRLVNSYGYSAGYQRQSPTDQANDNDTD